MADEKPPSRISRRRFATSCSEMGISVMNGFRNRLLFTLENVYLLGDAFYTMIMGEGRRLKRQFPHVLADFGVMIVTQAFHSWLWN
ncbi:MAG: hypothetical protein LUI12_11900 [Clostridiales bacterium]|nr:hypothetical protein [Clostridiales bacterium]